MYDHWKSYNNLGDVKHGLCNHHHLRELNALIEQEKEPWAIGMRQMLVAKKENDLVNALNSERADLYQSLC